MATEKRKKKKEKETKAPKKKATSVRRARPTAMHRLERGEGDAHVFWEISQFGAVIKIRHGKYLSAGRTSEKRFDDKQAATAAFEKAIEEKRADGFSEPTPKEVIGGSSRKGVSARNPELEALIEEDPADLSRYLIYADWLQQQGDPRGELIVAQHTLATAPEKDLETVDHVEWRLLRDFGHELLGPVSRYTLVRQNTNSLRGLAWRCGFIRAMRWESRHSVNMTNLRDVLAHPSTRFLEIIVTNGWLAKGVCKELREHAPKTFTTLSITTKWSSEAIFDSVAAEYPHLKRLWVSGGLPLFHPNGPPVVLDRLEELDLGFVTPDDIEMLSKKAKLPNVTRVHLTLGAFDRDVTRSELLAPMQALLKTFPGARQMTLRRWMAAYEPQDVLADAILTAFKEVPHQVTDLNLHLNLSQKNPPALVNLTNDLPKTLKVTIPVDAPPERDREDVTQFHHERERVPPN
jgi:uncharacterized protein (TIGR02996 family)